MSSFLTVVMAAIFALSLVPAGAFASEAPSGVSATGDLEETASNKGTLTIANTKLNEAYDVYRLFELASFTDKNNANGNHVKDTEAYSYVINDNVVTMKYGTKPERGAANKWIDFLTEQGPKGTVTTDSSTPAWQQYDVKVDNPDTSKNNYPYAMWSDDYAALDAAIDNNETLAADKAKYQRVKDAIYFVIERESVTLNLPNPHKGTDGDNDDAVAVPGYHVVRGVNGWDLSNKQDTAEDVWKYNDKTAMDDMSNPQTSRTDVDGQKAGLDYATITNAAVQDFAQEALKFARAKDGDNPAISPNYVETGVGKPNTATGEQTANDNAGAVIVNHADNATGFVNGTGIEHDGTGNVPLGYYLVGTSMGTLAALDTTNDTVNVYEKNDEPTIEKKVMKKGTAIPDASKAGTPGSDGVVSVDNLYAYLTSQQESTWVEDTESDINDYVQFRTVVTAQQGAKDYVLHDVMERGLTVVDDDVATDGPVNNEYAGALQRARSPRVFLVREVLAETEGGTPTHRVWYVPAQGIAPVEGQPGYGLAYGENYDITYGKGDGCDFEIEFHDATTEATGVDDRVQFRAVDVMDGQSRRDYEAATLAAADYTNVDVKDGDRIVVLYWAKVNDQAAIWQGEQSITANPSESEKFQSEVAVNDTSAAPANQPADGGKLAEQKNKLANGNGRNDNYTVLTYGAKSHTVWDRAQVTTYGFDLTKTKELGRDSVAGDEYPLLDGATFSVRKAISKADYEVMVAAWKAANPSAGDTELNDAITSKWQEVKVQGESGTAAAAYYLKAGGELAFVKPESVVTSTEPNALALADKPFMKGNDYVDTHVFYRYAGDGVTGNGYTTEIKPTNLKSAHLYGLDAGVYVLTEEKAPTGYNKLAHPIVVTVTGDNDNDGLISTESGYNKYGDATIADPANPKFDGNEGKISVAFWTNDNVYKTGAEYNRSGADWWSTIETNNMGTTEVDTDDLKVYAKKYNHDDKAETDDVDNGGVQVVNQTGAELPSTGGIGTTIFYVVGTVLVVGAAVMLVAKRRMGAEA